MKSILNELQDLTGSDSREEYTMCIQTAEPYGELPSEVDKEMAISKLKNRKATGHYQIRPNWLREKNCTRSHLWIYLKNMRGKDHTIWVEIWHNMPVRKNNVIMCDNYRTVTFLCTTFKILVNILYVELGPYTEEMIRE